MMLARPRCSLACLTEESWGSVEVCCCESCSQEWSLTGCRDGEIKTGQGGREEALQGRCHIWEVPERKRSRKLRKEMIICKRLLREAHSLLIAISFKRVLPSFPLYSNILSYLCSSNWVFLNSFLLFYCPFNEYADGGPFSVNHYASQRPHGASKMLTTGELAEVLFPEKRLGSLTLFALFCFVGLRGWAQSCGICLKNNPLELASSTPLEMVQLIFWKWSRILRLLKIKADRG